MLRWRDDGFTSTASSGQLYVALVSPSGSGAFWELKLPRIVDTDVWFGRCDNIEAAKTAAESAFKQWLGRAQCGRLLQPAVNAWAVSCFADAAFDPQERLDRFAEEALELLQSLGMARGRLQALIDYVFNRPAGDPKQEVAGTLLTLAALCTAHDFNMQQCGEEELVRLSDPAVTAKIRAKHLTKPKSGPLPGNGVDHA